MARLTRLGYATLTTRFEVEEEQLAFIREFFSKQEREVMIEKKNSLI
jgi:hypothetical protein